MSPNWWTHNSRDDLLCPPSNLLPFASKNRHTASVSVCLSVCLSVSLAPSPLLFILHPLPRCLPTQSELYHKPELIVDRVLSPINAYFTHIPFSSPKTDQDVTRIPSSVGVIEWDGGCYGTSINVSTLFALSCSVSTTGPSWFGRSPLMFSRESDCHWLSTWQMLLQ